MGKTINKNIIDNKELCGLLNYECLDIINDFLRNYFNNAFNPNDLDEFADYLDLDGIDIINVKVNEYETIDSIIYIDGLMTVEAWADAMYYIHDSESEESEFSDGSMKLNLDIEFSLEYGDEKEIKQINLDGIKNIIKKQ